MGGMEVQNMAGVEVEGVSYEDKTSDGCIFHITSALIQC